jgi:hypothetical protein
MRTEMNAKLNSMQTQQAEAKAREEALLREIALLKQAKVRVAPTTTQELLEYTANEFAQVRDGIQECDEAYVRSWETVRDFHKLGHTIKDSFAKALAGEAPDATSLELSPFFDRLTKALGASGKKSTDRKFGKGKKCTRCGRAHDTDDCYAKTHVNGTKLE